MDITRWSHQNQIDYILCSQRQRSSKQSAKTRPGADCASDHELLIAKFRLKLKKVGKTSRPFRYDLNQIPYDYTVEVTNRFKRLDLVDRMPEEQWTEILNIVQEAVTKTIPPKKRNARRQSGCLRRPYKQLRKEVKGKGEKERYTRMQSSKEQRGETKKRPSVISAKKQRKI